MAVTTLGIDQFLGPAGFRHHHFGLPLARWQSLAGQTAWIIGAGTGYGRSIAVALAGAGTHIVLSGRRVGKLRDSIDEMQAFGIAAENATIVPLDVTDGDSVEAAAADVRRRLGRIHILVHSAAVPPTSPPWPLTSMRGEQWHRIIETNVSGAWRICRAAMPDTLAAGSCRVVLLTSEAGWAFTPGVGDYNVAKSALNNLGASLAAECVDRYPSADVQINVLIPGEARTEMNQASTISPYAVVPMTLALISHPPGGPNGRFFHRDGRHFSFGYADAYDRTVW